MKPGFGWPVGLGRGIHRRLSTRSFSVLESTNEIFAASTMRKNNLGRGPSRKPSWIVNLNSHPRNHRIAKVFPPTDRSNSDLACLHALRQVTVFQNTGLTLTRAIAGGPHCGVSWLDLPRRGATLSAMAFRRTKWSKKPRVEPPSRLRTRWTRPQLNAFCMRLANQRTCNESLVGGNVRKNF